MIPGLTTSSKSLFAIERSKRCWLSSPLKLAAQYLITGAPSITSRRKSTPPLLRCALCPGLDEGIGEDIRVE